MRFHRHFVCSHCGPSHYLMGRRLLFGGGGKTTESNSKKKVKDNTQNTNDGDFSNIFSSGGSSSVFPPGFDMQKFRTMQEMIKSQPLDKQMEMMKKALEFQKTLGKIPGVGKLARKNIEVMEHLVKIVENQQHQQQEKIMSKSTEIGNTTGVTNNDNNNNNNAYMSSSMKSENKNASGPTIDELKKINLGSEIEALFAELALMRKNKNTYRDKLITTEEKLEKLQAEVIQLRETDINLRTKLRKVEQDIILLNSENMELKEKEKEWKRFRKENELLMNKVHQMEQSDAAIDRQRGDRLQMQLKEKEETLRSLQRKLERLRRRDPLLKFSRLCNNVARLCDVERDNTKDIFDDAFAALQSSYEEEQDAAWEAAVVRDGVGACAYAAVVRRFFLSRVPHVNYDSLVTIDGDVKALEEVVREFGFTIQHTGTERYVITAAENATADTLLTFLGPYGVSVGLYLAGKLHHGVFELPFKLTSVSPHVSTTLFNNAKRATVQYDTARSSGPGGQAANVTETQIIAKLLIDGKAAYVAEAQDSRSALSNREAATEKLGKVRRQQYNEQLAKQFRIDGVERQLVHIVEEQYKDSNDMSVDVVTSNTVVDMVRSATGKGQLSRVDFVLVCGMFSLSQLATTVVTSATTKL